MTETLTEAFFSYPHTDNLFTRNEETHKLNLWDFKKPEFGMINKWHVTEKIDGTSCRVIYDPSSYTMEVRGRTDNAQMHPDLIKAMEAMFPLERLSRQFDDNVKHENTKVIIFGEGYGPGIQKAGQHYRKDKSFIVFDIAYIDNNRPYWCNPSTVEIICGQLYVPMVPVISSSMSIENIVEIIQQGTITNPLISAVALDNEMPFFEPEGYVCRTDPYLYNHRGERVMFKLKPKELPDV